MLSIKVNILNIELDIEEKEKETKQPSVISK